MIKQIEKSHVIPALSGAATYETRIDLGIEVKRVLGYYVQVLETGSIDPKRCKVSFANSSKTIFEPVGLGHLIVGDNVEIAKRFYKEVPFQVDGYINSKLTIPVATVGVMEVQYILLVETTS